jgi:hypothetical protein
MNDRSWWFKKIEWRVIGLGQPCGSANKKMSDGAA